MRQWSEESNGDGNAKPDNEDRTDKRMKPRVSGWSQQDRGRKQEGQSIILWYAKSARVMEGVYVIAARVHYTTGKWSRQQWP